MKNQITFSFWKGSIFLPILNKNVSISLSRDTKE